VRRFRRDTKEQRIEGSIRSISRDEQEGGEKEGTGKMTKHIKINV